MFTWDYKCNWHPGLAFNKFNSYGNKFKCGKSKLYVNYIMLHIYKITK